MRLFLFVRDIEILERFANVESQPRNSGVLESLTHPEQCRAITIVYTDRSLQRIDIEYDERAMRKIERNLEGKIRAPVSR